MKTTEQKTAITGVAILMIFSGITLAQQYALSKGGEETRWYSADEWFNFEGLREYQFDRIEATTLKGTITGFRNVNTNKDGQPRAITLIRLDTDDGESSFACLGETGALEQADLTKGDEVSLTGSSRELGDAKIFFADSIEKDGKSLGLSQLTRSETVMVIGHIRAFSKANLEGKEEHLCVRLNLEEGTDVVVDFGPSAKLENLELKEGDLVVIKGAKATVDGKTIIVADLVAREIFDRGTSLSAAEPRG